MRILKLEFENLNSLKGHWKIDFTTEKKFYTTRVESGLTGYCASRSTRADVFICSYRGFLSCVYLSVRLSRGSILR